jgi:hypothetical protein
MKTQAVVKPKRDCVLLHTRVGTRVLINNHSFHNVVLDQDPPPGAPLTITIAQAMKRSGLSRATINRLMNAIAREALGIDRPGV